MDEGKANNDDGSIKNKANVGGDAGEIMPLSVMLVK